MSSYATTCPEARTCTLLSLNSRSNSGHPGGTVEACRSRCALQCHQLQGNGGQPCLCAVRARHPHAAVAEQQLQD